MTSDRTRRKPNIAQSGNRQSEIGKIKEGAVGLDPARVGSR